MGPGIAEVVRHRRGRLALIALAAAIVAGLVLAGQGWRHRGPDEDVLRALVQAHAFVQEGRVPRYANHTDLGSHFPPGTMWLALPGVLLTPQSRHAEAIGSVTLYLATLAGLFVLATRYFGRSTAIVAASLYALSPVAVTLAPILWPRGHPFFLVWMAYAATRWVDDDDGRWLALAGVVWAAGLYVHLELAPAALMLPVLWGVYRPRIHWPSLSAAIVISMVLWAPYLDFQRERAFIDLRSQLTMTPLSARAEESIDGCVAVPMAREALDWMPRARPSWAERLAAVPRLAMTNFRSQVLGGDLLLFALMAAAIGAALSSGSRVRRPFSPRASWWVIAGAAIAGVEVIVRWGADPALVDGALGIRAGLIAAIALFAVQAGRALADPMGDGSGSARGREALALALLAPYLAFVLATEPYRDDRMFSLWPLQILLATAFALSWRRHAGWRWARAAVLPLVVAAVVVNPVILERIRDWRAHGWSGVTPAHAVPSAYRDIRCH